MKQLINLAVPITLFYDMIYSGLDIFICEFNQLNQGDEILFIEVNSQGEKTGYFFKGIIKCILVSDQLKKGSCVVSFVIKTNDVAFLPPKPQLRS